MDTVTCIRDDSCAGILRLVSSTRQKPINQSPPTETRTTSTTSLPATRQNKKRMHKQRNERNKGTNQELTTLEPLHSEASRTAYVQGTLHSLSPTSPESYIHETATTETSVSSRRLPGTAQPKGREVRPPAWSPWG